MDTTVNLSCPRLPEDWTPCWGPDKLQRSAGVWRGVTSWGDRSRQTWEGNGHQAQQFGGGF